MESGNPQRAADFLAAISDEVVDTAVFGRSEFLQGYSNGSRGLAATLRELQVGILLAKPRQSNICIYIYAYFYFCFLLHSAYSA